ncbi:MFS transporter [Saccharopolyspora hirsuta]|uniref:MFS transporter n=2 Tax=Saccharopolyspora hirsuta TaxID=1837 RepID=UPI00332428F2
MNPARYQNRLLLILFLSFGFVFFDRQALSFLAPMIREDFPLSNTQLGALSGVLALTWAVSGMVVGTVSDRIGKRKPLLIAAILGFSACSAASGLMTGFTGLLVARALMGLAEGAVLPMAQSLMIEASQPHRRGLNMGLVQGSSAGLLGGIVSPIVVVWAAEHVGWRSAFLLTIVPGLVLAAWVARSVREVPPGGRVAVTVEPGPKVPVGQLLKQRNIVLCMAIAACYLTWFVVIITFAPTYLAAVKGYPPATMSAVMACFGIAWVLWGFATPAVSDRIGRRRTMIAFTAVAALCPLAVVLVAHPLLLGAIVVLTYTGLGCFTLFMATIPAETVPGRALATALGLVMGIGELCGGFLAPMLAGWASDEWGLQAAMFIAVGGAVVVTLLSFGLRETAPLALDRRVEAEA